MLRRWPLSRLDTYVFAVIGVACLVAEVVALQLLDHRVPATSTAVVLAALLIVGESRPIVISRDGEDADYVTIASTFILALVLVGPAWLLLLAEVMAVTLDDVRHRKPLKRLVFNNAQLLLSAALTRGVFCILTGRAYAGGGHALSSRDILPALVAGAAFFAVNNSLTGIAVALSLEEPVLQHLREDVRLQLTTSGILLAFAPVIVVAIGFSVLLLPLMLLPIVAVHRGARLVADREHQALHDPLTGLGNRELLTRRGARGLRDAQRSGLGAALLLIDLDHFKEINDTLGHYVGDLLLMAVARRLEGVEAQVRCLVRLGGDEFALLITHLPAEQAHELAERLSGDLLHALSDSFSIEGVRLDVEASIGIALAPDHGTDVGSLMQSADVALYSAKVQRNAYRVYDPAADGHSVEKLALLGDLREGLERGEIRVHYQPQCDATTGEVVGVEALVRWQHPRLGLLAPAAFLAVADNTGLADRLTMRVLEQALADRRSFGDGTVRMSVNLSVRALADLGLPAMIGTMLRRWEVPRGALTLEVTESMIMVDPGRAVVVLRELRDLGVQLSIDDFGTGYSSLAYLARLEVHELKIDRSFVTAMLSSEDSAIVRSTIHLGHSLGLRVVAEGVEDAGTWQALREFGCDVVQGFHLGRPQPADPTALLLAAQAQPVLTAS